MVGIEVEKLDLTKLAPRRILIVDDYPNTAESFAKLLRHLGHDVDVAFDGLQAVEIAESRRPDIVLLDIGMPRMNGYEAAEWIREQPWGKQIRLVALTGWQGEEHRQRSLKAGFDAHVVKPIGPTEILLLLVNLLEPDVAPK